MEWNWEGPLVSVGDCIRKQIAQMKTDKNTKSTTTLHLQLDRCEDHLWKPKRFVCVTCRKSFCEDCHKNEHKDGEHPWENIEDAYERVRGQWGNHEDVIKDVRVRVRAYQEGKKKIDQLHAEGLERLEQMRQEMEDQIQALRYRRERT